MALGYFFVGFQGSLPTIRAPRAPACRFWQGLQQDQSAPFGNGPTWSARICHELSGNPGQSIGARHRGLSPVFVVAGKFWPTICYAVCQAICFNIPPVETEKMVGTPIP